MKIVNLRQGTAEWLAWRDLGVSASDVATILGENPHKTPWSLWAERTGLQEKEVGYFCRQGKRGEPVMRRWWEEKRDTLLFPACAEGPNPRLRASFDGLDDDGIPVEIKVPTDAVFQKVKSDRENADVYKLYRFQVQAQIYVSEQDHGFLVFGRVAERDGGFVVDDVVDFRIERDDALIAMMLEKAEAFMSLVTTRTEPSKDPARDFFVPTSEMDMARWKKAAEMYRETSKQIEMLTANRDKAKADMLNMMGQFAAADADGIQIKRYPQKGSVDYKAFLVSRSLDPEKAEAFRNPSSMNTRVTIKQTGAKAIKAA